MNFVKTAISFMSAPHSLQDKFMVHVASEGLSYGTAAEFEFRFQLFEQTDKMIEALNANPENTFISEHNFLSTLTEDEKDRHMGRKSDEDLEQTEITTLDDSVTADSVDWRSKGAVNSVKNQGGCGSCWAFSATAVMEGHHKIKSGKLVSLSEQELVDCHTGSNGCKGGNENTALQWLKSNGQYLSSEYPYTGKDGKCQKKSGSVKATSFVKVNA